MTFESNKSEKMFLISCKLSLIILMFFGRIILDAASFTIIFFAEFSFIKKTNNKLIPVIIALPQNTQFQLILFSVIENNGPKKYPKLTKVIYKPQPKEE